jgi:hypothetical protein
MTTVIENQLFQQYAAGVEPARQKFAQESGMTILLDPDIDPLLLECFFIYFSSRGVALTEPVEDWLIRSGQRCEEVGFTELGRAIRSHAKAEAGHHHMMIKDTHALVKRWNTQRMPPFNAVQLLAQPPTPGGVMYRKLHEETIASNTPFAQIAIEFEIEMLPVQYGPQLIRQCKRVLGPDILACLSFIDEHITLDVGHTKFNTQQLEKFLNTYPEGVTPLTVAGSRVLAAYATFMHDCLDLAQASVEALLC